MIHEALLSIGLLIVVAKLAEGIFRRFGLNSIVAYAVTGLILGPITGIVEPTSDLQLVLGIGVFVFFFLIGLDEIDISGFVAAIRGRFFVAATVSVVISLVAALTVTSDLLYDFGLGLEFDKALALAGILSLSSLGHRGEGAGRRGTPQRPTRPSTLHYRDHRGVARSTRRRLHHRRARGEAERDSRAHFAWEDHGVHPWRRGSCLLE